MADPMYPDLRMWEPGASNAKCVLDTNMLNTEAHETPDTVNGTNENVEDTNKTPVFGPLGAQGRR